MCFYKITPCCTRCDLALKLSLQKYLTKEVRWEEQGANDWYLGMPCPILVALLTYLMSAHSYLFTLRIADPVSLKILAYIYTLTLYRHQSLPKSDISLDTQYSCDHH